MPSARLRFYADFIRDASDHADIGRCGGSRWAAGMTPGQLRQLLYMAI